MKKQSMILAACLAAAVGGVAVTGGTAQSQGTSEQTITATEVFKFGHRIDRVPKGPSAGDMTEFGGRLRSGGEPFGNYQGSCTSISERIQQCLLNFSLPGGRIAAQARYTSSGKTAITPIVGGIRDFSSARGQILEHQLGHGRTRIEFQLVASVR